MQDNSDLIIRDCCEAEAAEFGKPDTICITVDVLREIVQRHFPGTCLHQIQEPAAAEQSAWHTGLDEGRAQAAPAAVAVPDERAAFEAWAKSEDMSIGSDCDGYIHSNTAAASLAWQARAALAATPEQPVVLPEPEAYLFQHEDTGQTMFVEAQQVEWGFEANNPRLQKISGVYTEQQLRALLAQAAIAAAPAHPAEGVQAVEQGEVLVTVSGFTGCGKSAIAGEIEIMCRALGLQVEWPDGDPEKNLTHADWTEALELYKPRVRIVECNVPHPFVKGQDK